MNKYSFVSIIYYLLLYLFVLIRRCYDTCTCNYQFNLSWFKSTKPNSRREDLLEVVCKFDLCSVHFFQHSILNSPVF